MNPAPRPRYLRIFTTVLLSWVLATPLVGIALEIVTYIQLDTTGSPIAATDEQGNVIWRETYRPFGSQLTLRRPRTIPAGSLATPRHETTSKQHHGHFEAYDRPSGRIIENTSVEILP